MEKIEIKLEEELNHLKNTFKIGYELSVKHLPNEIRYSQNNKLLSGELQGNIIIIYEDNELEAVKTLYHEFIEYIITPLLKNYVDIINNQNNIISMLLYGKREEIVDQLCNNLFQ